MLAVFILAVAFFAALAPASPNALDQAASPGSILEIRSYNLKCGTRARFHHLFVEQALPMLKRWNVDVVGYGPSLHDRDSYFLMRAFTGLENRERSEDAFYGSAEWRDGPRAAILAAIETYTTVVIRVDENTLGGLRHLMKTPATASDLDTLVRLNDDYIQSVKTSNVDRFREILADDFLATLADGTLVDRDQFLANTAKPHTLRSLEAQDVNVRILGDFAIIHARTTFTLPDGTAGSGRYTDIWARRQGRWLAVAAHVTRK
jgi:hypothetical protein